ncbi:Hypothetical_protein [Hexamita inflata]|uniref:Hypothetical_protein n=1 Tax=Hexamita inflata TaxID=28002 RepID=A0AA86U668_9EUKA|nr:Hypothetical protein HINF_LOCUS19398 [Hexamita inflata]
MSCYFNDYFYSSRSSCKASCSGMCIQYSLTWQYCCKPKGSLWWLGPLFGGIVFVFVFICAACKTCALQKRRRQLMQQARTSAIAQQGQLLVANPMQIQQPQQVQQAPQNLYQPVHIANEQQYQYQTPKPNNEPNIQVMPDNIQYQPQQINQISFPGVM